MKFSQRLTTGVVAVLLFGAINSAMAQGRQTLRGHVPEIVTHLQSTGRLPGTTHLNLSIGLPLRNKPELGDFIQQVSDPMSPNYRHYLTLTEFTERFGPTEKDYQAVINFARANGLAVTGTYSNRVLLDVNGSVTDIEKALHVTMRVYRHPTENRTFFSSDSEPSLDLTVPVLDISGLNDLSRPYPKYRLSPTNKTASAISKGGAGSGPTGNYIGNDFRATYAPGVSLTGAGQTVALVQFDGYYLHDVTNYENLTGLPNVTLTNVLLDGFTGVPVLPLTSQFSGNLEVSLDIEMVISMAPGVTKIILYEGNPTNAFFFPNHVLNRIAVDNAASQISSSWGWNGGPDATTEQIFQQMIAQGQTYFNASGDSDAFPPGAVDNPSLINEPSSSTNITQVGGTTLLATNPVSETVWNWGGGQGSSGGISSSNGIPSWQTNISMVANHGSTTKRNIPDVAMTADNVFIKYGNGLNATNIGGTSCAAPLWAGFIALVNQQAALAGQPVVGFINPAIYAIGKGASYTADFHDVTSGNNFSSSSPANFPAVAGYDLCTGWGTPNGMNLITALATPDVLGILPGAGFVANGVTGGPFDVTSQNFSLTNSGGSSLDWTTIAPVWLAASPTGGTLPSSGSTAVSVNINSNASNLLAGIYAGNLIFTNLTSHIAQGRQFTLQMGQSIIQNGGFETGDFTSWTLNGMGISGGVLYNGVVNAGFFSSPPNFATNFIRSGTYGVMLGDTSLAILSQTIPTLPGQSYLISFWINNKNGATPNQFEVNWNTNIVITNTIFYKTNMATVVNWTNMLFVVTAAGTNTILQFGAENDNDYFGLDDVSVVPIPIPSFRTFSKTNNLLNFMWNSLAGVQYQLQFSTNLIQTNWVVLGTTITATNGTATVTNGIGPDPTRFYRIKRLP